MIGSAVTRSRLYQTRGRDEKETDAWPFINVGSSPIIAHQYTFQKGHRGIL
jgi:hypothetical protein